MCSINSIKHYCFYTIKNFCNVLGSSFVTLSLDKNISLPHFAFHFIYEKTMQSEYIIRLKVKAKLVIFLNSTNNNNVLRK